MSGPTDRPSQLLEWTRNVLIRDCEFCFKMQDSAANRQWYDYHVIWRGDHWNAVLPIGPLRVGHLMLVSNEHYSSYSQAPLSARTEFDSLAAYVIQSLEQLSDANLLVFEHGSGPSSTAGCIDHAHVHFVPGLADLAGKVFDTEFSVVSSMDELVHMFPRGGYAMTYSGGIVRVASDKGLPSQFFRRRVRRLQGLEDEWDYLMYKRKSDMLSTLEMLKDAKILSSSRPLAPGAGDLP